MHEEPEIIRRYGNDLYLFIYGGPVMKLSAKDFVVTGRYKSFGGQKGFSRDGDFAWVAISERDESAGRQWKSGLVRKPIVWTTQEDGSLAK